MRFYPGVVVLILVLVFSVPLFSQTNTYILNGSARQNNCNCYTLTTATNTQSGSVWNANKISLSTAFDFIFNVYLGTKDADGADGIVFILQPISTSVGNTGEGMGFQGIVPSVGIAIDTWQNGNLNDPFFDHISIQTNGNSNHNSDLAGPMQASVTNANIEDGNWHTFRITWNPATQWLRAYFDQVLRVEKQVDMIATIFNNDPMVYWGFSAGTGGSNNLQQFCTALNPGFTTDLPGNTACEITPVNFTNTSASFAPIKSYYWDFGDGNNTTVENPPTHTYTSTGVYTVKQVITGFDGCISDTLKTQIIIADKPQAAVQFFDTCTGKEVRFADQSTVNIGTIDQWHWSVDGSPFSTEQSPDFSVLQAGVHDVSLSVASIHNCVSDPVQTSFNLDPSPIIEASAIRGCMQETIELTASQIDNQTNILSWDWDSGHGDAASDPQVYFIYPEEGEYQATVVATADNGCESNLVNVPVTILQARAFAGNDTVIIKDEPYQLLGTGGVSYEWSPATGLSDPFIANPITVLQDDISYLLKVTTDEGCVALDTINITVFKGSAIYVPTGFTPNKDGLNETLIPFYMGIKTVHYFEVFNRWGEKIFTTNDVTKAWDGTINGYEQATGIYIWKLKAVDWIGKVYELNGTTTLIR